MECIYHKIYCHKTDEIEKGIQLDCRGCPNNRPHIRCCSTILMDYLEEEDLEKEK